MKNYKLIGLTGQTGTGKSEVASLFNERGFEVIYADFLAREIMSNPVVLSALRENFGEDVAPEDKLNRKLLAQRAFKNRDSKKLLDSITHPFITTLFLDELKRMTIEGAEWIVFDASQLFESGLDVMCDAVISVTAPEPTRLERITQRDGISDEEALSRMSVQYPEEFFRENSDFIINNNNGFDSLRQSVKKIIKTLEVRFGSDKKA